MDALIITLTIVVSVYAACRLGAHWSVELPTLNTDFDQKPFNCRPCMTFHLVWIFTTLFAAIGQNHVLLVAGFVVAFAVFFIIKHIDNKKVVE